MKNIILFAGITFVMVVMWIGFSIYHNQTTSTVSPDLSVKIVPIIPVFDTDTLNDLKRRKSVIVNLSSNLEILGETPNASSSPKPTQQPPQTIIEQPIASGSSQIENSDVGL